MTRLDEFWTLTNLYRGVEFSHYNANPKYVAILSNRPDTSQ